MLVFVSVISRRELYVVWVERVFDEGDGPWGEGDLRNGRRTGGDNRIFRRKVVIEDGPRNRPQGCVVIPQGGHPRLPQNKGG